MRTATVLSEFAAWEHADSHIHHAWGSMPNVVLASLEATFAFWEHATEALEVIREVIVTEISRMHPSCSTKRRRVRLAIMHDAMIPQTSLVYLGPLSTTNV